MGSDTTGFELIKKRTYEIIESSRSKNDLASRAYDILMFFGVIVGLLPLAMKAENPYTRAIDVMTALIFLYDYVVRLWTADYKMGIKSYKAYLAYVVSPMAIVDLLSILPILCIVFPNSNMLALFRILRVLRVLKLVRYSKTMIVIENMFRKVKQQLFAVLILVFVYIIVCALVMFQVEPELFDDFFGAIYWSAISITTVGYGDLSPQSDIGRLVAIISSLVGVAVIALPTGIITAAYTEEIKRKKGKHEL